MPFELRNDFARLAVAGLPTAGATYLLDDSFRRRRVALLSGESSDTAQQLLSPLYYIRRALQPYADLIEPRDSDVARAVPELLKQHPSVLVMADIGTLPEDLYKPLEKWIDGGGTLIRFAGPRLAGTTGQDPLMPVKLRAGERALGGTMSWSQPQKLADFPSDSPFAGMKRPDDVTVKRQVLAEPSPDLQSRTWASLADGTPLVTAKAERPGPHRALPRHRRADLVEPADFRLLRRHAAAHGAALPRIARGQDERRRQADPAPLPAARRRRRPRPARRRRAADRDQRP